MKVEPAFLKDLFEIIYENPSTEIMVDLPSQLLSVEKNNLAASFEISSYKKNNLLNGFDDIDYLLNIKNEINDFAKKTLF